MRRLSGVPSGMKLLRGWPPNPLKDKWTEEVKKILLFYYYHFSPGIFYHADIPCKLLTISYLKTVVKNAKDLVNEVRNEHLYMK